MVLVSHPKKSGYSLFLPVTDENENWGYLSYNGHPVIVREGKQ